MPMDDGSNEKCRSVRNDKLRVEGEGGMPSRGHGDVGMWPRRTTDGRHLPRHRRFASKLASGCGAGTPEILPGTTASVFLRTAASRAYFLFLARSLIQLNRRRRRRPRTPSLVHCLIDAIDERQRERRPWQPPNRRISSPSSRRRRPHRQ